MFDFSTVKKDFPNLNRLINGKRIVYLDSTASTLKPQTVIDAVNEYYSRYSVNVFRGLYKLSEEATARYEEARGKTAKFINANSTDEVVFVRNATEAVNLVASTWGRMNINDQDEILSTIMEHHANIVPWQQLAQENGAQINYLDISQDGKFDIKQIEKSVNINTKLLVITQYSNVLGTINPIKEIIIEVKKRNSKIKVLVDGAQSVPHMKVSVKDLGCDFLVFSGHKMLGPTGIGVLWGKYNLLDDMPPFQMGGDMIKEVYIDHTVFKKPPHKFEAGTPHISGAIGLGAAIDYLEKIGMENIRNHEKGLTDYALTKMKLISGLKILGPDQAKDRGGIIAFTMDKCHPHDIAQILDDDNICVRSGHHCAMPLHTRLKLNASCRASFYLYNTKEDVDMLIAGLYKVQKIFRK